MKSAQVIAPLESLFSWMELCPIDGIVGVLDKALFPRWIKALQALLAKGPTVQYWLTATGQSS